MNVRLAAEVSYDSIVDGPGLRAVIWFQGCKWNCKGCHNPQTHDMLGGFEIDINELINSLDLTLQAGVTLSGGDPFFQPDAVEIICKKLKEKNVNIWCYTGFLFEELMKKYDYILKYIDVIVDGPFILEKRDLNLVFKGSSNQRIIDVQKTLEEGNINKMEIE